MAPSISCMVLLLLVASVAVVRCRPQDAVATSSDVGPPPSHGFFIEEIVVFSDNVAVAPKKKTPKKPKEEESDGPRFFRFVGGPAETELSVGSGSSSSVGSGAGISISGSTLTFNKPAEVIPIASE